VELREFRNYRRAELELGPGMVVVHGPNGAGKSSLLEGIGVAALGEGVRAREAGELIRTGEEYAFVGASFGVKSGEVRVEVGLGRRGQKQIKIGGVVKRRADLIGLAPVVYFSADDIWVVRGEPSGRRRLVDQGLCAVSRQYYFHVGRYRKGLEQRNRLLKEVRDGTQRASGLEGWDRALARYGAKVMVERRGFIEALGQAAREAHGRISGGGRCTRLASSHEFSKKPGRCVSPWANIGFSRTVSVIEA
jgi:DNA replication and repair protein RecF